MADIDPRATAADAASALAADFSSTARALFAAGGVQATLTEVVRLTVATIEGCDYAGILLVDGEDTATPLHTDPVAAEIDTLQRDAGEGPCLDAIHQATLLYADDLTEDSRWPRFGPMATARGVQSLLTIPLLTEGTLGALNLYARSPRAFGVIDRAKGVLLAELAAVALASALTHEDDARRSENLHVALTTREMIGQAQGILMEREGLTAEQAFDILRRASQHLNVKLREVAQALVDTGEQPDTGA